MTQDDQMREFARSIFAPDRPFAYEADPDAESAPAPDPLDGNHVSKEGTSIAVGRTSEDRMREFARDLFTHSSHDD